MKNIQKILAFSVILLVYGIMFMATSKPCDEECEASYAAGAFFGAKPYVAYAGITSQDGNRILIIGVDTAHHKDWNLVADTACTYLKDANLANHKAAIINKNNQVDTLAKRDCF